MQFHLSYCFTRNKKEDERPMGERRIKSKTGKTGTALGGYWGESGPGRNTLRNMRGEEGRRNVSVCVWDFVQLYGNGWLDRRLTLGFVSHTDLKLGRMK